MTLTFMALLLFLAVIGVIMPLVQRIRIRLLPKFASLPKRTRYTFSILTIYFLLYEFSFLFVYGTDHLSKFPKPWGDIYWISAGVGGIIGGLVGINNPQRWIWAFSILQITLGFGILGLLVLAIGIASM